MRYSPTAPRPSVALTQSMNQPGRDDRRMLPVISPVAETESPGAVTAPGRLFGSWWNVSVWPGTLSVAWTCRLTGKPTETVVSAGAARVIVPYASQVKLADPLAPV